MGLFDFASNLGKKLFGSNEDPAEEIQKHIESDNPGIEGLSVTVEDGVASVSGSAKDQAAFEKAILMAGNVQGIKEVKADSLQLMDNTALNVEYYTIQAGDSLWAIAQKHLGNGNDYTKIFEANKEVIKDPDLIYPGQKIRIPVGE
ncbi:peptidoglycan-binding protein LysM [Neptunomonas qingdaonensis]|uniref:BON domain-containing protein n=1 Tax=Neptunomonas qingdaonensis TaxID=1045558 RepID=A0A1I2PRJ1_9GAMM|nr:peptidoglycan-binding protein LysM [Neptunomonas qingdaonensis]SFG18885.1 BON domain-containing protein [Neptunomonas qingdaonensis]